MTKRCYDPHPFNLAANHPAIRPWLGGKGVIDVSSLIDSPLNVAFGDERGGFILRNLGWGRYEVHTVMLPKTPRPTERAFEMLEYMFIHTDCQEIITQVPTTNPRAGALAERCGFKEIYLRDNAWEPGVGVSYRKLDIDFWAASCYTGEVEGHRFHDALEAAKVAQGSRREVHGDDKFHDRIVGVALLMVRSGNVEKAVVFYNKWAQMAGYGEVQLVSRTPVILDIGDAVIEFKNGNMENIQCR